MSAELLTRTLGSPLPEEFSTLSETQLAELDRLLRTAREQRAQTFASAVDSSLELVPRLLRPAVKKALGL